MFDELDKYNQKGHFFLQPKDSLKDVCNAPADKSGVYIMYALLEAFRDFYGRLPRWNKKEDILIPVPK